MVLYPRIELGIDIENADKVSIRYDGRMFSLSNYIKECVDIKFDTSLFKTGDIVKISGKIHKRFDEIELNDQVGMIEHFSDHSISYATFDSNSESLKYYNFTTIDFIRNNIEEFTIEKVNIQ